MDDVPLQLTPRQRRKRRIVKALQHTLFAAFAYGLLVLGARLVHRRVVYQPPDGEPAKVPEGATLLTAKAADGVTVNALSFAPTKKVNGRTIVHFHGNAETADDNVKLAHDLEKRGFEVILVEYRGYGRSKGESPTEEGLYLDAVAVLDALDKRGVTKDRVVLWGQSLGAGVASEMARRDKGTRLVLVAPLASTLELAKRAIPIPILPLSWVFVDRFDTLGKAPEIQQPALVVHGDADDVIPFEQGEKIKNALPHATMLKVAEGKHDNLYKSATTVGALAAHAGGT
jgi:uncharacterized protein